MRTRIARMRSRIPLVRFEFSHEGFDCAKLGFEFSGQREGLSGEWLWFDAWRMDCFHAFMLNPEEISRRIHLVECFYVVAAR
jgi:hypothetical protein